jgi:outer membrane lipoprotein SlyB
MKKTQLIPVLLVGLSLVACQNNPEARYLDLNTGEYMAMKKDSTTGLLVNAQNGQPVDVYVDTQTHDTIWGPSGKVVNGHVEKTGTHWKVRDDGTTVTTTSDDVKVKTDDGDTKVKNGSYTKKVDKDGDVKIETGDKTIKIDGETGERKVKKDKSIGDKIKKVF